MRTPFNGGGIGPGRLSQEDEFLVDVRRPRVAKPVYESRRGIRILMKKVKRGRQYP